MGQKDNSLSQRRQGAKGAASGIHEQATERQWPALNDAPRSHPALLSLVTCLSSHGEPAPLFESVTIISMSLPLRNWAASSLLASLTRANNFSASFFRPALR